MASEAELEKRASAGDARAQFALGRLLLDGPRAVADGARGVALIEQAADSGDSDALAMAALFDVMGMKRPPDWERALDRLQRAAEGGSTLARLELGVLARNSKRKAASRSGSSWAALRSRIAVADLMKAGERTSLNDKPPVRVIERFATPAECKWLIERARERLTAATVIHPATGTHSYQLARTNRGTEFQLPDMDLVIEAIRTRMSVATGLPLPFFEPTQVLHYSRGQEFRPHFDFLNPANPAYRDELSRGQRVVTFLIYLNEGFAGGETDFPDIGIRYKGATGDAIFWANVDSAGAPDPLTRHAGLPPTSGEKWILSQWIRGRPGQTR